MSNLELSEEVKLINSNTDGIGLFRTEYLYMNRMTCQQRQNKLRRIKKFLIKLLINQSH